MSEYRSHELARNLSRPETPLLDGLIDIESGSIRIVNDELAKYVQEYCGGKPCTNDMLPVIVARYVANRQAPIIVSQNSSREEQMQRAQQLGYDCIQQFAALREYAATLS